MPGDGFVTTGQWKIARLTLGRRSRPDRGFADRAGRATRCYGAWCSVLEPLSCYDLIAVSLIVTLMLPTICLVTGRAREQTGPGQ